jgi:hypothetical protein
MKRRSLVGCVLGIIPLLLRAVRVAGSSVGLSLANTWWWGIGVAGLLWRSGIMVVLVSR